MANNWRYHAHKETISQGEREAYRGAAEQLDTLRLTFKQFLEKKG